MAQKKYYYNEETCQYELIKVSSKTKTLRISLYLLGAAIVAVSALLLIFKNNPTPKEISLTKERQHLDMQWQMLDREYVNLVASLEEIQFEDHDFREILDLEELPEEIREAGIGGNNSVEELEDANLKFKEELVERYQKIDKLKAKLNVQKLSLDTLSKYAEKRDHYWSHIPAIQPVDNKDLDRLSTVYGMRLNPVLNKMMPHKGFDFMADPGTPIYATGDGVVILARMTYGGFGNQILIDHGYGYKTRYAHLNRTKPFNVKVGDRVKRGQVIGYMGNTGRSAGPHLHYEVLENGRQVLPLGFFQRELEPQAYDRLLSLAKENSEPMDF